MNGGWFDGGMWRICDCVVVVVYVVCVGVVSLFFFFKQKTAYEI